MKINLKEDFIMWENITIFIGQAWKLVFAVLHWTSTHISVGWLSFGVALLAFTRNNHKKYFNNSNIHLLRMILKPLLQYIMTALEPSPLVSWEY